MTMRARAFSSFRFIGFIALTVVPALGFAQSTPLSLDAYLGQVEGQNKDISASRETSQGAELSSGEAKLIYSPTLFADVSFYDNRFRNATFPDAYRSLETNSYQVGVRQQTRFGLTGALSYLYSKQGFLGTIDQQTLQFVDRRFYEGTPKLELTLSLWRNWGGGETRANEEIALASARVTQFNQSYQVRSTRASAENAYVRLVGAQQLVKLYQESYSDAQDILNWNNRRMRQNLGESSDLLQAQGNSESQKLSLQSSLDDLRVAARDFNRLRNIDSDEVKEVLVLPSIDNIVPPARAEIKDDVRAAQESARLSAAQAVLAGEKSSPTVEAYTSLALNGREIDAGDTFAHSFRNGKQTTTWGVRMNIPLEVGVASDVRHGYQKQRDGAEMLVNQKIFNQEVEWKDLVQQLAEAKHRYDIADSLSKIQKKKVLNERTRLKTGRTTTYQTLIFNIDFNSAEVSRIQAQSNVLNILARMRTFGESKI